MELIPIVTKIFYYTAGLLLFVLVFQGVWHKYQSRKKAENYSGTIVKEEVSGGKDGLYAGDPHSSDASRFDSDSGTYNQAEIDGLLFTKRSRHYVKRATSFEDPAGNRLGKLKNESKFIIVSSANDQDDDLLTEDAENFYYRRDFR